MSNNPGPDPPQHSPAAPDVRHTPWRPKRGRRIGLKVRRFLATLLAAGLIALLVVLLVQPFRHPRTQLIVVRGPQIRGDLFATTSFPSSQPFVEEDCAALAPLTRVLDHRQAEQGIPQLTFDAPTDVHILREQIEELADDRRDVLIVYATGQGITDQTSPYLVFPAGPQSNLANRVPMRQMLSQFADCRAGVKLLVVSAGPPGIEAQDAILNEFPRLLKEAVEATGDRSLWVLLSQATGEQSHSAYALRRSVFGAFVSRGLLGAADLDGDQTVNLEEFFRYVAANVAGRVRQTTGGSLAQHPQLFWGGGEVAPKMTATVTLVPVPDEEKSTPKKAATGKAVPGKTLASRSRAVAAAPSAATSLPTAGVVSTPRVPQISQPRLPTTSVSTATALAQEVKTDVQKTAEVRNAAGDDQKTADAAKPASAGKKSDTPASPADEPSSKTTDSSTTKTPKTKTPKTAPPAAKPAETTPAKTSDGAKTAPAPAAAQTPGELLAQAWRLRDALESPDAGSGPVVYAPHLWRAFQEQLIQLEWMVRTSPDADGKMSNGKSSEKKPNPLTPLLRRTVDALAALQSGSPELSPDAPELLQRIHAAQPRFDIDVASVPSIGMAQRLVRPLPPNIALEVREFDGLLETGSRGDVQAWAKKLPPGLRQFSEIRLTLALLPLVEIEWETLRLALQVRRLAERVSADPGTTGSPFRDAIARADRFRRAGERILLDRIGSDRGTRARQQLQEARRQYQQVLAGAKELEAMARLQRELAFRASWYVGWYRTGGTAAGAPEIDDLLSLLKTLRAMSTELYGTDSTDLTTLRRLAARLTMLRTAVESSLDGPNIVSLTSPPVVMEDGWQIESLLATPLPPAATRVTLLNHVDAVHAAVADQWRRSRIPDLIPASRSLTVADWRRLRRVVDLERELLRLAVVPLSDTRNLLNDVQAEADQLRTLFDQRAAGTDPDTNEALQALRDFENSLESAYGGLAIQIRQELSPATGISRVGNQAADEGRSTRTEERIRRFETALHAVRVCGGARIDISDIQQPAADLQRLQWRQLVLRQHERVLAANQDAPPSELAGLTAAADEYQQLPGRLSSQDMILPKYSMKTRLDGPSSLSLILQDRTQFTIEAESADSSAAPAWIILDYDPDLLRVEPTGRQVVYRQDPLREKLRNDVLDGAPGTIPARAAEYPLRPDLASLPPTLTIPADTPAMLPLAIQKVPGASGPAWLIVKVLADGQVARHEIEIEIPQTESLEVRVAGVPESWSEESGILTLFPFPNRTTDYQVSLVNTGPEPRTVAIELFTLQSRFLPSLPTGGLPADAADRIRDELNLQSSLLSIPKVALPNTGEAVPIPFPKLPAQGAAPDNSGKKPMTSPDAAPAPPNIASPAPAKPSGIVAAVDDGMLLIVRDQPSGRVVLKPIRVLPQSPRRFLQVAAGYNQRRQRIEVTVTPKNPALLPPGGVHVSLEFAQPLPTDAEQHSEGVLAAPGYEARLYAAVPTQPGRVETIFVNVDDFPQAFVYKIDCSSDQTNVAEATDRLAVRITNPPAGTAYRSPQRTIPVDLQVDAPPGAFRTGGDFVEIGIDVDQDGEFHDESPLRLDSDRQVEAALAQTTPQGGLAIATRIGDYSLSLPALGVRNQHVNLLARVKVGGRSVWSREVEVVFDGSPPQVDQIRLNPALQAELGKPVTVLVEASDAGLSGVDKVEATFDVQHTGRFGTMPPPVPARRDDQGQWRVVLPTTNLKTGAYSILVRATDQVGNVSQTDRAEIKIITPEQAAAMRKAAAVTRINGVVLVGGKPRPGIEVTLKADPQKPEDKTGDKEQPPTFAPTQSDDSGAFVFASVPPGKYTLTASGVVYNKTRTANASITVDPAPQPLTTVELRLE